MEAVHLLKYPWVNGVVLAEVGSDVMVKLERGDCRVLGRDKLGKGQLFEGFDKEVRSDLARWVSWFRKSATDEVKDEVVDLEVGEA